MPDFELLDLVRTPGIDAEEVLSALAAGADPNAADSDGGTPLMAAAWAGRLDLVQALLAAKARPGTVAANGRTALDLAAWRGHADIARELIAAGAWIHLHGPCGRTALHYAALGGQEEAAKLLLDAGAILDSADNAGRTPLSCATRRRHAAVVQLLVEAGADVEILDRTGRTALDYALRSGDESMSRFLRQAGARGPEYPETFQEVLDAIACDPHGDPREEAARFLRGWRAGQPRDLHLHVAAAYAEFARTPGALTDTRGGALIGDLCGLGFSPRPEGAVTGAAREILDALLRRAGLLEWEESMKARSAGRRQEMVLFRTEFQDWQTEGAVSAASTIAPERRKAMPEYSVVIHPIVLLSLEGVPASSPREAARKVADVLKDHPQWLDRLLSDALSRVGGEPVPGLPGVAVRHGEGLGENAYTVVQEGDERQFWFSPDGEVDLTGRQDEISPVCSVLGVTPERVDYRIAHREYPLPRPFPGEVVEAVVRSDDYAADAEFDARPWLMRASVTDVAALAGCGWSGDYAADSVAEFMRSRSEDVNDVLTYVEVTSKFKDQLGFECEVNEEQAMAWLKDHRPELYAGILEASEPGGAPGA